MLKHCGRCRMTTAWVEGACQRCAFLREHGVRKAMSDETKAELRAVNAERRARARAKKRGAQS